MLFSLQQRLWNMNISKKDLEKECLKRDRKVSYDVIRHIINGSYHAFYEVSNKTWFKVLNTIEELEAEKGIKSIEY